MVGRGFLIDMDGVIYRGKDMIPGADDFIHRLNAERIPYLFLTNVMSRLGCIAWVFRPTNSTSLRVPWRPRGFCHSSDRAVRRLSLEKVAC